MFINKLLIFIFSGTVLFGAETKPAEISSHIKNYLDFANNNPDLFELGTWKHQEIEIILDPERIQKIERQATLRLQSEGCCEGQAKEWSSVGIVAEDDYWIWIRDPVIFPSGVYGTYDRLMWKSGLSGTPAVAILPLLSNKKIVVNIAFRHATRKWELELPRGRKKASETDEKAAVRELLEETGYRSAHCTLIGSITPDSGVLMSVIPVFSAEVKPSGERLRIFSKAIANNPAFSKDELKEGFMRGYIEVPIKGNMIKVNCRDPYLAYALLQAEMKGLL